jgi:hypothetical protein
MKKIVLLPALVYLVVCLPGLFAVPADVIYAEGDATVKYKNGATDDAYIGDVLNTGDTVTTGYDGFVELDQAGLSLKINPETVFSLQEKERAGETEGVFSVVLGSIKFRFDRLTGKEPLIQTGSAIAGVRGTEFSVYAGADGSSLVLVDSGLVTVEAEGQAVELAQEEGVEVRPGQPPGDKFAVKRDQIDYASWNEDRIKEMLADPKGAIASLLDRLQYYIDNASEYNDLYTENKRLLDDAREKGLSILNTQGRDAARQYDNETITPIANRVRISFLNVRYFSLTALSLRRYVAGRMYVYLKSRYIADSSAEPYNMFIDQYARFLTVFEESIAPHLVEADI